MKLYNIARDYSQSIFTDYFNTIDAERIVGGRKSRDWAPWKLCQRHFKRWHWN